jgi:prephenate dehydrogenase
MKIGVYGMGRFGQFWARLLRDQGYEVLGYNRSPRDIDEAIPQVDLDEICRSDVLFLTTAISSIPEVAGNIAGCLDPGTLVIDTCSVKLYPLQQLEHHLPAGQPILGTHPMFGPDSAVNGIEGLPLVITPWTAGRELTDAWQERFVRAGLRVLRMSADEHDHEAARTQGITHFIGRFLSNLDLKPSKIGTVGYEKIFDVMEQTCNDPWQLFIDLQRFNPYTAEIRRRMTDSFESMITILDDEEYLDSGRTK